MKFILGNKLAMTQTFREDGTVLPVTAVLAGPCTVTQIKGDKDGYQAVQVGFGKAKKLHRPQAGHLKGLANFRWLREFRLKEQPTVERGQEITVNTFQVGDLVTVTSTSKGKGFQGVVKRHGFHGSPKTHGHKDQLRMPGSIGAGGVAHVFKGTRMAGRMGGEQVSVHNLEVVEIDSARNILYLKGAVPGARNGFVMIKGQGDLIIEQPKQVEEVQAEVKSEEATVEASAAAAPEAVVPEAEAQVSEPEVTAEVKSEKVEEPVSAKE